MSLFGPSTFLGIDIGTFSIKLVEAKASKGPKGLRVLHHAETETPPGAFADGQVLDAGLLAGALRTAFKEGRFGRRKACMAVSPQFGFVRKFLFPKMPLKDLRATVDLQRERYIPYAREGAVWDMHLLSPQPEDEQMAAVIAAAPTKTVADLMTVCRLAGLTPARMDLEPLALYRALGATQQVTPDLSCAIVDLGRGAAKISLFDRGVPVINRVVDLPNGGNGRDDPFAGIGTESLFLDIRRSLEFALTQTNHQPSRIFIAGGLGADPFLGLSLSAYLRGFLANRLPADFQVEPVGRPESPVSQSFMLALGLSLPPEMFA